MNTHRSLDFLTSLFTSLDGEELYVAPADNPAASYATASLTDAARFTEEEKARVVFISTGTFQLGKQRTQEHLLCVPIVALDADLKDALVHEGITDAEHKVRTCSATVLVKLRAAHVRLLLDTLARAGIESPSAVVFTGGGHHAHLLLDYLDQRSIKRIRDVHKALVSTLNTLAGFPLFDPQVVNSGTRFIRVPGTANIKCDPVRWAEVVQNSGPIFTLEQLKQAAGITAEQPEKESEQPQEEQTATPGDTWHCPFIAALLDGRHPPCPRYGLERVPRQSRVELERREGSVVRNRTPSER